MLVAAPRRYIVVRLMAMGSEIALNLTIPNTEMCCSCRVTVLEVSNTDELLFMSWEKTLPSRALCRKNTGEIHLGGECISK